jgi:hypothetical protein
LSENDLAINTEATIGYKVDFNIIEPFSHSFLMANGSLFLIVSYIISTLSVMAVLILDNLSLEKDLNKLNTGKSNIQENDLENLLISITEDTCLANSD